MSKRLSLDTLSKSEPSRQPQPLDGRYSSTRWVIESTEYRSPEDYEDKNFTHLLVFKTSSGHVMRHLVSEDWDLNEPENRVLLLDSIPDLDSLMKYTVDQYDELFGRGALFDLYGYECISASLSWRGAIVRDKEIRAVFVFCDVNKFDDGWRISERTIRKAVFERDSPAR